MHCNGNDDNCVFYKYSLQLTINGRDSDSMFREISNRFDGGKECEITQRERYEVQHTLLYIVTRQCMCQNAYA